MNKEAVRPNSGDITKDAPDVNFNVMTKDEFEHRIGLVFEKMNGILSKSFGPYGSNTFISLYPVVHPTKDGYTIMKYIDCDTHLDRVILSLASTVCSRLNNTVGDGTTTSTIAAYSIYQAYREYKSQFDEENIVPKDIVSTFKEVKNSVIDILKSKYCKRINLDNDEEFATTMKNIINISTNGDEEITNLLVDMYKELKTPAIDIINAADGITKSRIIEGYGLNAFMTDSIYITTDDNTMEASNVDIMIFSYKIGENQYNKILKPLNMVCSALGRRLVVMAPYYDDIALKNVIGRDLIDENEKTGRINMVLTAYQAHNGADRTCIEDFAMLCNTRVITPAMERDILETMATLTENPNAICHVVNLLERDIPNITTIRAQGEKSVYVQSDSHDDSLEPLYASENMILNVGFCRNVVIGRKRSTFSGFLYNKNLYEKYLADAERELKEAEYKYRETGAFNFEISEKLKRLYGLRMKMGVIEVGGTSDMSQKFLRDTVTDAVKAASSAFNNGVIHGCNVDLMMAINDYLESLGDLENPGVKLRTLLASILFNGFYDVYRTILRNKYRKHDEEYQISTKTLYGNDDTIITHIDEIEKLMGLSDSFIVDTDTIRERGDKVTTMFSAIDSVINASIRKGTPFNLVTANLDPTIINSVETDSEILTATVDLIALIIAGNQLVIDMR